MTAQVLKSLPTFAKFCREMKPYLELVRQSDVEQLLQSLYRAAKIKVQNEELRLQATTAVPWFRIDQKKMARANTVINKALKCLAEIVDPDVKQYLVAEQEIDHDLYEFGFDEMVEFLTDAAERARTWKQVNAAYIHPDLRNKTEKQLVKKFGEVEPHSYPARPKSSAINHWFMGTAAKCLDQARSIKGTRIPNYGKIISKVFEVAFRDHMTTEASITRELHRQKKRPIKFGALNSEDARWLSNLGQNSARIRSGRTRIVRTKAKRI
jgi:hypothetical protein